MKKIAIVLLILFLGFQVYAQDNYKVIKVNGSITIKSSGKGLSTGTVFSDNEYLIFGQPTAKAAVINPEKGRFVITPSNADDLMNSKSNFIPGLSNIASRASLKSLDDFIDIRDYFSGDYMIFDTTVFVVNNFEYKMTDTTFFYCRYKYNNEEINKKISFQNDSMLILKNDLLSIDGNPVPSDSINALQLFYYQKNENKSTLINTFNPIFAGEQLKAEVQVILDELSDKSFEEKFESVYLYIIEFYCHPDEANLRVWLKSNFDI